MKIMQRAHVFISRNMRIPVHITGLFIAVFGFTNLLQSQTLNVSEQKNQKKLQWEAGIGFSHNRFLNYSGVSQISNTEPSREAIFVSLHGGFIHKNSSSCRLQIMASGLVKPLTGMLSKENTGIFFVGAVFGKKLPILEQVSFNPSVGLGWLGKRSEIILANGSNRMLPLLQSFGSLLECALRYDLNHRTAFEVKTGCLLGDFNQKELPADIAPFSDKSFNPMQMWYGGFNFIVKF